MGGLKKAGGRPPALPVEWEAYHTLPSARQVRLMQEFTRAEFDFEKLGECAIRAGFKQSKYLKRQALQALRPFSGNQYLRSALLTQGIDFSRIAAKINEMMDAQGVEGPDRISQRWATEMAIKIHDALPASKMEIEKHETREFVLTEDVQERIRRARVIEAEVIKEDEIARLPAPAREP